MADPAPDLIAPDSPELIWLRARKTRPIWVRRVVNPQVVQTLEGDIEVQAGACLCRGVRGELWPQSEQSLEARYVPAGGPGADGWRQYVPRPDAAGVLASQMNRPFRVQSRWGVLTGKSGDFLVKDYAHQDDAWLVAREIFLATYEWQSQNETHDVSGGA